RETESPAKEKLLSPAARRLVEEKGVDLSRLEGTGPGGRIMKEDVLALLEQPAEEPKKTATAPAGAPARSPSEAAPIILPAPPPTVVKPGEAPTAPRETRQRLSAIRQRIAERLVAAQHTAAILTTFNEADLSAVMALRARFKDAFKEKH